MPSGLQSPLDNVNDDEADLLGFRGADAWQIRVRLRFNEPAEHRLLDEFTLAAVTTLCHPGAVGLRGPNADQRHAVVREFSCDTAGAPLYAGDLVVDYRRGRPTPVVVAWEFAVSSRTCHVVLRGPTANQIDPRPLDEALDAPQGGVTQLVSETNNINEQIRTAKIPVTLDSITSEYAQPVRFEVDMSGFMVDRDPSKSVAADVYKLVPSILADRGTRQTLHLRHVLAALTEGRFVITDNYRGLAARQVDPTALSGPADLSDGTLVAADLARLKNGDVADREAYRRAQETFHRIHGRHVEITQRPAVSESLPGTQPGPAVHGWVVEPRISRDPGEDGVPLQAAGAGAQEALFHRSGTR